MAKEATSETAKVRTNTRSKQFDKLYDKLSDIAKGLVDGALALYLANPAHPGLRTHKLKDSKKGRHQKGSISISASRHVSAICVPLENTNLWYWVGSHEAYNGFTGSGRH